MTALHVANAAEVFGNEGPTGRFVEVIEGEIHDAGGNVLYSGTAGECREKLSSFVDGVRKSLSLVPTKVVHHKKEIGGSDCLWDCFLILS